MSDETYPITDPRHPLVMKLTCAERAERKWKNIADFAHAPSVQRWAESNAKFYTRQIADLKTQIATATTQPQQP